MAVTTTSPALLMLKTESLNSSFGMGRLKAAMMGNIAIGVMINVSRDIYN